MSIVPAILGWVNGTLARASTLLTPQNALVDRVGTYHAPLGPYVVRTTTDAPMGCRPMAFAGLVAPHTKRDEGYIRFMRVTGAVTDILRHVLAALVGQTSSALFAPADANRVAFWQGGEAPYALVRVVVRWVQQIDNAYGASPWRVLYEKFSGKNLVLPPWVDGETTPSLESMKAHLTTVRGALGMDLPMDYVVTHP
jgi:hypothetical protein